MAEQKNDHTLTLGYWPIQFKGEPLKILLAVTHQHYKFEPAGGDFPSKKNSLGFDFPNLPYLIDGDFKLTETDAIAKYIAIRSNRTDLFGKSPKEEVIHE